MYWRSALWTATEYVKLLLFLKHIFSFFEYICIIDAFIYFDNTASVVKGGIYVVSWHTEQHPNESLSPLALKHWRMTMTVPRRLWIQFNSIQFLLHVQGCTVSHSTVSHHTGELAMPGFYAFTTSLSSYIISSECQFTVFSKEYTFF